MTDLCLNHKAKFLKFLKGELPLSELELFISQTIDLEKDLGTNTYIELLTFDYKDKYAANHVEDYILEKVISESKFETWKLTELLQDFINHPQKAKDLLDKVYHLYSGTYNRQGELTTGYRFLGNLGLNYFFWIDEGYLRTTFGDSWKVEYEKSLKDIEYYHQQLKPIAEQILQAIIQGEIKIISKKEYQISNQLKKELEADSIFQLTHPSRSTGG
ncbi:hypothetical protein EXU57_08835 [Segetibacter sp. 3557_3]|uniref:hypothetical protein n=1 Tax=Segetibacter sp. 3557_3 TaxID=2547429 RepID=UPI001058B9CA|nr:hypothetical protein [Segetibacter sp. 3557_3]TDH26901.1 hypothetical protein EXU57_08835 [Segetibacter sp. 3557_3]